MKRSHVYESGPYEVALMVLGALVVVWMFASGVRSRGFGWRIFPFVLSLAAAGALVVAVIRADTLP